MVVSVPRGAALVSVPRGAALPSKLRAAHAYICTPLGRPTLYIKGRALLYLRPERHLDFGVAGRTIVSTS